MYILIACICMIFLLVFSNVACNEDPVIVSDISHSETAHTPSGSENVASSEIVSSGDIPDESDISASNTEAELLKISGRLYKYDTNGEIKNLIITPERFWVLSDEMTEENKRFCDSTASGTAVLVCYKEKPESGHRKTRKYPEVILPEEISLYEENTDMIELSVLQDIAINYGYFQLVHFQASEPFLLMSQANMYYPEGIDVEYTYSHDGRSVMISYPLSEEDITYYVPLVTFSLREPEEKESDDSLKKGTSIVVKKYDKFALYMDFTRYDYCFYTDDHKIEVYEGAPVLESEKVIHTVSDEQLLEIMQAEGTMYEGYSDLFALREAFLANRENEDHDTVKWVYQVFRMLDRNMEEAVVPHVWVAGSDS